MQSGADPLVRAGPPGPALQLFINITSKPARASAAVQEDRPTKNAIQKSWENSVGHFRLRTFTEYQSSPHSMLAHPP
jgi:hypothetical protein